MHNKLPQTKVETAVFLLVVSFISVNLIGPIISFLETEISLESYLHTLTKLPFVWIAVIVVVIICEFVSHKIAVRFGIFELKTKYLIQIIILMNVFLISFFMTIIGAWIAMGEISFVPFNSFFVKWPRNLVIAALVELIIAQPIAHRIMIKMHSSNS